MTDFIDKNNILRPVSDAPLVAILLCTYNGARFLAEQLDSLESQTHQNWVVIASDDGSSDSTLEILRQYKAKWPSGKLTIRNGPQKGFCQNFLSLACDPEIKADYYAFCDQDDVWLPVKLEVALANIVANQSVDVPYLYCGRTIYVTKKLKPYGMSPLFVFPPSFRNALVQSIAGGNTMVFNLGAKKLIEKVGMVDVPSHDWWVYQLISGGSGDIFYDTRPWIFYRQHEHSLIGESQSYSAKLLRTILLFRDRFQHWIGKNVCALNEASNFLTSSNKEILRMFVLLRSACLKDRIRLLGVCGLYRQTRRDTLFLFLVVLIKKI